VSRGTGEGQARLDALLDKMHRAALGFEDGVWLFSDVRSGDVKEMVGLLRNNVLPGGALDNIAALTAEVERLRGVGMDLCNELLNYEPMLTDWPTHQMLVASYVARLTPPPAESEDNT